jgi:hypothetical protein
MTLSDINETTLLQLDPSVAKAIVEAQANTDMITSLSFAIMIIGIWFALAKVIKYI